MIIQFTLTTYLTQIMLLSLFKMLEFILALQELLNFNYKAGTTLDLYTSV